MICKFVEKFLLNRISILNDAIEITNDETGNYYSRGKNIATAMIVNDYFRSGRIMVAAIIIL